MSLATADTEQVDCGRIDIHSDECKGCGFCIVACPIHLIRFSEKINRQGYRPPVISEVSAQPAGSAFMCVQSPVLSPSINAVPAAVE